MRASLPLRLFLCAALPAASGCVSLPEDVLRAHLIEAPRPDASDFGELDPGAKSSESAHFLVRAYSTERAQAYASFCEESYTRLMNDLGLYSFAPARPYNIVVYADSGEFLAKTRQPSWSGGVARGNSIYVYESDSARGIIAHEIAHLVFKEFMGGADISQLTWLNEGIAVHAEKTAFQPSADSYGTLVASVVSHAPLTFTALASMPPGPGQAGDQVRKWYAQAGGLVTFMIRAGGNFNFYLFLKKIKEGLPLDSAVSEAFAGSWRSMEDADRAWRATL